MLSRKSKLVAFIFSVLFLLILKYAIDHNAETLPQVLQLIAYGALPIAGGLITLSFCSLLEPLSDAESSATFHLLQQISEGSTRNFSIGFLVTAYLSLVRPPLVASTSFLPYIEWVAIALAVYLMYSMPKHSTKESNASSEALGWKEHIQKVKRETGRDLMRITSGMEQFVDHGVKEPLLVYLTLHLQRLGEIEEGIINTLSPLIDYQKNAGRHKLYLLFFPWAKRKFAMRSKKAREYLLNTLLEKIDGLWSE